MTDGKYLIHRNPFRSLLVFAVPMMIGNVFQQLYQTADSVLVGRFVSENALAAIGASASLVNIFICLAIGAGQGATVMISRYFGAEDYSRMKQCISTVLLFFICFSAALGAAGLFCSARIMTWLNTPAELMDMADAYLRIYFLGFPFLFLYNLLSSVYNALGNSRTPLYFLIFSSLLNVAADILLICRFHMGVEGAAAATVMSQAVSALLSYLVLRRNLRRLQIGRYRRFSRADLRDVLGVAVPSMIQQSTVSIGMMLIQSVVNGFGAQALAGFSAAVRVENIAFVPMTSISSAVSAYMSQNIGAKRYDRIGKGFRAGFRIVILFALLIMAVMCGFHGPITSLFLGSGGTETAVKTANDYMFFIGFFFVLLGGKTLSDGSLRGMRQVKVFMIANFINLGIRIGISMLLAPKYGIAFVWYSVPVGWAVNFAISFAEFRRQYRKLYAGKVAKPDGDAVT